MLSAICWYSRVYNPALIVTRRSDPDEYRDFHIPLHFLPLFQEEGKNKKKLYVKTLPFPSTHGGYQRCIGRKIHPSRPLLFTKGVLKSQLFYIVYIEIKGVQNSFQQFNQWYIRIRFMPITIQQRIDIYRPLASGVLKLLLCVLDHLYCTYAFVFFVKMGYFGFNQFVGNG